MYSLARDTLAKNRSFDWLDSKGTGAASAGMLTGKYARGGVTQDKTARGTSEEKLQKLLQNDRAFEVIDQL